MLDWFELNMSALKPQNGSIVVVVAVFVFLVSSLLAGVTLVQQNQNPQEKAELNQACYDRCRANGKGNQVCRGNCGGTNNRPDAPSNTTTAPSQTVGNSQSTCVAPDYAWCGGCGGFCIKVGGTTCTQEAQSRCGETPSYNAECTSANEGAVVVYSSSANDYRKCVGGKWETECSPGKSCALVDLSENAVPAYLKTEYEVVQKAKTEAENKARQEAELEKARYEIRAQLQEKEQLERAKYEIWAQLQQEEQLEIARQEIAQQLPQKPKESIITNKDINAACNNDSECTSGNCQDIPGGRICVESEITSAQIAQNYSSAQKLSQKQLSVGSDSQNQSIPANYYSYYGQSLQNSENQNTDTVTKSMYGYEFQIPNFKSQAECSKYYEGNPYAQKYIDCPSFATEAEKKQNTYNTYNAITFGKFGEYVAAFQPEKVKYTWQSLGYSSLEACQNYVNSLYYRDPKRGTNCSGVDYTQEQNVASIRLGTTVTGEAAAIIATPAIAASGSIWGGLTTAFRAAMVINTSTGTLNTAATCIEGDPDCTKQVVQTATNWAFLGSTDALNSAYATLNGPQAVRAIQLNAAASAAQAVVNYDNTVQACQGGLDLDCGVNLGFDALLAVGITQNAMTAKNLQASLNRYWANQAAQNSTRTSGLLTSGQIDDAAEDIITVFPDEVTGVYSINPPVRSSSPSNALTLVKNPSQQQSSPPVLNNLFSGINTILRGPDSSPFDYGMPLPNGGDGYYFIDETPLTEAEIITRELGFPQGTVFEQPNPTSSRLAYTPNQNGINLMFPSATLDNIAQAAIPTTLDTANSVAIRFRNIINPQPDGGGLLESATNVYQPQPRSGDLTNFAEANDSTFMPEDVLISLLTPRGSAIITNPATGLVVPVSPNTNLSQQAVRVVTDVADSIFFDRVGVEDSIDKPTPADPANTIPISDNGPLSPTSAQSPTTEPTNVSLKEQYIANYKVVGVDQQVVTGGLKQNIINQVAISQITPQSPKAETLTILISGWGQQRANELNPLAQKLAETLNTVVIPISALNIPESGSTTTFEVDAKLIRDALTKSGIQIPDRVIIVGHSDGVGVANSLGLALAKEGVPKVETVSVTGLGLTNIANSPQEFLFRFCIEVCHIGVNALLPPGLRYNQNPFVNFSDRLRDLYNVASRINIGQSIRDLRAGLPTPFIEQIKKSMGINQELVNNSLPNLKSYYIIPQDDFLTPIARINQLINSGGTSNLTIQIVPNSNHQSPITNAQEFANRINSAINGVPYQPAPQTESLLTNIINNLSPLSENSGGFGILPVSNDTVQISNSLDNLSALDPSAITVTDAIINWLANRPFGNLIFGNLISPNTTNVIGGGIYRPLPADNPLIIDPQNDPALQRYMLEAQKALDVGQIRSIGSRVRFLTNYVYDSINYAHPDDAELTAIRNQIYSQSPAYLGQFTEAGTGVCIEMAACLHVLLANAGIPNNLVIGSFRTTDGEGIRHAWVEYFDGQWMVANPTDLRIMPRDQAYSSIFRTVRRQRAESFVWPNNISPLQRLGGNVIPRPPSPESITGIINTFTNRVLIEPVTSLFKRPIIFLTTNTWVRQNDAYNVFDNFSIDITKTNRSIFALPANYLSLKNNLFDLSEYGISPTPQLQIIRWLRENIVTPIKNRFPKRSVAPQSQPETVDPLRPTTINESNDGWQSIRRIDTEILNSSLPRQGIVVDLPQSSPQTGLSTAIIFSQPKEGNITLYRGILDPETIFDQYSSIIREDPNNTGLINAVIELTQKPSPENLANLKNYFTNPQQFKDLALIEKTIKTWLEAGKTFEEALVFTHGTSTAGVSGPGSLSPYISASTDVVSAAGYANRSRGGVIVLSLSKERLVDVTGSYSEVLIKGLIQPDEIVAFIPIINGEFAARVYLEANDYLRSAVSYLDTEIKLRQVINESENLFAGNSGPGQVRSPNNAWTASGTREILTKVPMIIIGLGGAFVIADQVFDWGVTDEGFTWSQIEFMKLMYQFFPSYAPQTEKGVGLNRQATMQLHPQIKPALMSQPSDAQQVVDPQSSNIQNIQTFKPKFLKRDDGTILFTENYRQLPNSSYDSEFVKPVLIVLHWDGNANYNDPSLWTTSATYNGLISRNTSSTFAVGVDGVLQMVPMTEDKIVSTWAYSGQPEVINIEFAGARFDQTSPSKSEIQDGIELVANLMIQYNLTIDDIVGHRNNEPNPEFVEMIKTEAASLVESAQP